MVKTYRARALVIKHINLKEADRIIVFYSQQYGKFSALAKGVRRFTSRKKGHLDIFSCVDLSVAKGNNLDIISELVPVNLFSNLRSDLKKVAIAYQIVELLDKLIPDSVPEADIYQLAYTTLVTLDQHPTPICRNLLTDFAWSLLKLLGYWPATKPITLTVNPLDLVSQIIEKDLKSRSFGHKVNLQP